ncbi:MAG: ABC transporter permease [Clostridiales bacterium]|nr:ABC transporter permease [Clostridiales bacterium]
MLAIAFEKMLKNKAPFLCMLIACLFSVSLFATMPAFENAVKKRMLQRELSQLQYETTLPPLVHEITVSDREITENEGGGIDVFETGIYKALIPRFGIPVIAKQFTLNHHSAAFLHISPGNESSIFLERGGIMYGEGLFDHVELMAGRLPNEPGADGIIEVVVSESAAEKMPFMLGSVYLQRFTPAQDLPSEEVRLHVVGIIRMADPADPFWVTPLSEINPYTTYESFISTFFTGEVSRFSVHLTTTFDHTAVGPENLKAILDLAQTENSGTLTNMEILEDAFKRDLELGFYLLVLLIPIFALLMFFIIMISDLILEQDKVEISLLYSRGAGKGSVLAIYAIQTLLISLVAIAAGIPLSLLLCSALGASSGFLEFVGRAPLQVTATAKVFGYATAGAALFSLSTLLPILFSKSASIVTQRRLKAVRGSKPFFEKYYLDLFLLGISIYGYFSYQNLSDILTVTSAGISEITIDPLVFLISSCFLMGCAMLIARCYPYLMRLLFHLGRSLWPPAIYASLSASRSRPRSRYIILFIIMTASISLYTSTAARTINQNTLDRAMYGIGADLVIKERWPFIDPNPVYRNGKYIVPHVKDVFFTEMPFEIFNEPPGVALATKVYRNDRTMITTLKGINARDLDVIAIYPDEFAQISWQRDDMYAYHLNHLMNAMSANYHTVLLTRNLMEQLGVSNGDEIRVRWENNPENLICYVYDAIEYFPTFDPVALDGTLRSLIVMNYELVESEYPIEPYEVWIRKEDGASSADILQYLLDHRESPPKVFESTIDPYVRGASMFLRTDYSLPKFAMNDARVKLASVLGDPLILSMNSFLTLNFIMILALTAVGLLLFWSFDLQSRRLQISIMRSAGMSQNSVIAMLLWEQALLSLLPLLAGFVLGRIGSTLFVPMFEMGGSKSPLAFRVFRLSADALRVGAIITGIILLTIAMLWYLASRIKISDTLKLGEE